MLATELLSMRKLANRDAGRLRKRDVQKLQQHVLMLVKELTAMHLYCLQLEADLRMNREEPSVDKPLACICGHDMQSHEDHKGRCCHQVYRSRFFGGKCKCVMYRPAQVVLAL